MDAELTKTLLNTLKNNSRYIGSAISFHKDGSDIGSVTIIQLYIFVRNPQYLVYDEESGALLSSNARDCGTETVAKAPCGRRYKYSYVDADGETIYIGACL